MGTEHDLIADPSNAGMVGAWDGNEGAFWAAQARRFDETLTHLHGPFLAAAAVGGSDRVLDVGCGNGQATRDAARIAGHGSALGVDLSSQMLAMARKLAADEGVDNVEFRHADAQIYPFERASFDVVMSRMGSMFFGDPVAAFTNLHGALRRGGRLALLTWQGVADNEWLTEFRATMAVGRELPTPPPERAEPVRARRPRSRASHPRRRGLQRSLVREPARADAFRARSRRRVRVRQRAPTGWMRDGLADADRDAALAALRKTIAEHTGNDGVTYQSATWIVEARKA